MQMGMLNLMLKLMEVTYWTLFIIINFFTHPPEERFFLSIFVLQYLD
jgi:hypothetical protein